MIRPVACWMLELIRNDGTTELKCFGEEYEEAKKELQAQPERGTLWNMMQGGRKERVPQPA
jgi:hypothetical protein